MAKQMYQRMEMHQKARKNAYVIIKNAQANPFLQDYTYNGRKSGSDEQIIEMVANASGIRDTSRILKISKQKVTDTT